MQKLTWEDEGGSRREIILKEANAMSRVFQNIGPPIPLTALRVCTSRLWCGGRTHSLGGEVGRGLIFWKTRDTVLYICKYFVGAPITSSADDISKSSFLARQVDSTAPRVVGSPMQGLAPRARMASLICQCTCSTIPLL